MIVLINNIPPKLLSTLTFSGMGSDDLFIYSISCTKSRVPVRLDSSTKLEKVALDGSIESCAPPPRWCDLEL